MAVSTTTRAGASDRYLDLVTRFPLRPLRNEREHQEARRVFRSLGADRSRAAADYKAVLVSLIASYERSAGFCVDTSGVSPADIVRHLLGERKMSVSALARETGVPQSSLSDMLSGKRDWSKSAIVRLSSYFQLNPGLFLRSA